MAYCRWLTKKLGYEIRLPTEWEWQQAASNGNPANIYPWGAEWNSLRCNTNESQLCRTIAVGMYDQNGDEYLPSDMAGNVWDWCLNKYKNPAQLPKHTARSDRAKRTVRGGPWDFSAEEARCAHRNYEDPSDRGVYLGFRLLRSSHTEKSDT